MSEESRNLYRLIYSSRAANPADRVLLVDICAHASKKNQKLDVTGVLLCVGNQFLQVLEGEHATVKKLYKEIRNDPRHVQCRIVHESTITARAFSGWGMNFIKMDDNYFLQLNEFQELRGYIDKHLETSEFVPQKVIELVLRIPKILSSYKIDIDIVSPLTLSEEGQ